MVGFGSAEEAKQVYLSNYQKGWTGMGAITAMSMEEFKKWVGSGARKRKPVSEMKTLKTEQPVIDLDKAGMSDDVDMRDLMDSYHENVDYELKYLKKDLNYIDEDIKYTKDPEIIKELKDQRELLIRNFIEVVTKFEE